MDFDALIDKIIAKRWIALVAIGALILFVAGAKGIWSLKIEDTAWRITIAALGILVILIGIWDALRTTDVIEKGLLKDYGFKITSPGDNANVTNEFDLEGTYETKPLDDIPIRSFVFSAVSGNHWTSPRRIVLNEAAKRWSVTVRLGGTVGDRKFVGVALLGKNAELLCRYYDDVTQRVMDLRRQFSADIGIPGIPEMPRDWKECAKITIRRVS